MSLLPDLKKAKAISAFLSSALLFDSCFHLAFESLFLSNSFISNNAYPIYQFLATSSSFWRLTAAGFGLDELL